MKAETVKLLKELNHELQTAGELDPETRELLREIHDHVEQGPAEQALARARELEGRFAASHPVADRIVHVLLDSLSKMGI